MVMGETQNLHATKHQVISLDSNEEDVKPKIATTPSHTTQGYWKQTHANKWPALEVAIFSYKYSLIRSDPFADSGALRDLALNAMEVAFETHAQFVIEHGMLEMVWIIYVYLYSADLDFIQIIDTTSSFRGNFKVEASDIVLTLYGIRSDLPALAIKEKARLAMTGWNYCFCEYGTSLEDVGGIPPQFTFSSPGSQGWTF